MSDDRSMAHPVPTSFPEVYRTHFLFVWRTLARLRVRKADLLDVTQNVFIIVHRQLPGFEGRAALTTWLYSICQRVARDYLRSALIRREVLVDVGEIAQRGAIRGSAVPWFDSQELAQLLESILSKLPEKLREAFVLFEVDELSGDEIARLLDIPVGTVRSRVRLARVAFRRNMRRLSESDVEVPPAARFLMGVEGVR